MKGATYYDNIQTWILTYCIHKDNLVLIFLISWIEGRCEYCIWLDLLCVIHVFVKCLFYSEQIRTHFPMQVFHSWCWIKAKYNVFKLYWGSTFLTWLMAKIALAILLFNWQMCLFQLRCSSIWIPRNVVLISSHLLPTLLKGIPFICKFNPSKLQCFCGVLITTYFVLLAFSLFVQNQVYNLFISTFYFSYKHFKSGSDKINVVSSAKYRISHSLAFPISLA